MEQEQTARQDLRSSRRRSSLRLRAAVKGNDERRGEGLLLATGFAICGVTLA